MQAGRFPGPQPVTFRLKVASPPEGKPSNPLRPRGATKRKKFTAWTRPASAPALFGAHVLSADLIRAAGRRAKDDVRR
jgi:hypothetical protein